MQTNTTFTTCDICQKSIKSGEEHLTLNVHKEIGSNRNGRKSVNVDFATTIKTTCLRCGIPLARMVLSDALIQEVICGSFHDLSPSHAPDYTGKEKSSEKEGIRCS